MFRKECNRMHYDYVLNGKLRDIDNELFTINSRLTKLEQKNVITWNPLPATPKTLRYYPSYQGYMSAIADVEAELVMRTRERDQARLDLDVSRACAEAWRIDSDSLLDKLDTVTKDLDAARAALVLTKINSCCCVCPHA